MPWPVIKYIGSKRLLMPRILDLVGRAHAPGATVLDPFSGTARVGHALKRAGYRVISSDHNAYAHALAACYVQADAGSVLENAKSIIAELESLPPCPGYFTETFCQRSRFIHPDNGGRIDAMRERIASLSLEPELESIVLVSLMEAADRVDSTTGLQMAYLKGWASRALRPISLRLPDVIGRSTTQPCIAARHDALQAVAAHDADITYLDPPYNQHSYLGNYHVWESLVLWDKPEVYGIACKRIDCKDRKSPFNSKRLMPGAMEALIDACRSPTVIVSFSDEGFLSRDDLTAMLETKGPVRVFTQSHPRFVGARIGIYNPAGEKVGAVGKLHNKEHLFIAGQAAQRISTDQLCAA